MPGFSFPRRLRLTDAGQFTEVFSQAQFKVSNRHFLVLARKNRLEHSRIGLVVGKKHLPKAVHRNRIKRLIRTSYRLNQGLLHGLDMVILARSNMNSLDNQQILCELQQLLRDLIKKSDAERHDLKHQ